MPKASVIMPTYNKSKYLELTLASFVNQTYTDFEIIIVDDGSLESEQNTILVQKYKDKLKIKYLFQMNSGRSSARNMAINQAEGEVMIFNDDDRIVDRKFIEEHLNLVQQDQNIVSVGWKHNIVTFWNGDIQFREGELEKLISTNPHVLKLKGSQNQLLYTEEIIAEDVKLAAYTIPNSRDNFSHYFNSLDEEFPKFEFKWLLGTTANLAVSTKLVQKVGLFDENFRGWGMEDTDFSYRLEQLGGNILLNKTAVNYHQYHARENWTDVARNLKKNVLYFCEKHQTLECYLFYRWSIQKMTLLEANELYKKVKTEPKAVAELTDIYRKIGYLTASFD